MTTVDSESALKGSHVEYFVIPPSDVTFDLVLSFNKIRPTLVKLLKKRCAKLRHRPRGLKFYLQCNILLRRAKTPGKFVDKIAWFSSETKIVYNTAQIPTLLDQSNRKIGGFLDSYCKEGSGWIVKKIIKYRLMTIVFTFFAGGCNGVSLPPELRFKRACVSIRNISKNKCFLYAVAACLSRPKKNAQRKTKYQYIVDVLDKVLPKDGLVTNKDINLFERKTDISVNVYAYESNTVFPHRLTAKKDRRYHVNLLLYEKHYFPIVSMSALISGQNRVQRSKTFVCNYCLTSFVNFTRYNAHSILCQKDGQRYEMPKDKDKALLFRNFQNLLPAPFVIYADLESLCMPIYGCEEKNGKSSAKSKHVAISVGAVRVCRSAPELSSRPVIYTGTDCLDRFLDFLEREYNYVDDILKQYYVPISLTVKDKLHFETQKECNMCRAEFSSRNGKFRDHCHLSGKYRQALCNSCNLNRAHTRYSLYVLFHGLSNYDSHFLVNVLARYDQDAVRIIPVTSEKYLTFSINNLHFKDSYKFMSERLEILAENLMDKGDSYFTNVNRYVTDKEQNRLMKRKGIFPYAYMTDVSVLKERRLPEKSHFFNDLTQQHISDEQYSRATEAWNVFCCRSMRDYMEMYLCADVLLLADVFENFRSVCLDEYALDPVKYLSIAHYTFDAFLRKCQPRIDLLTDVDHYLFFRKALRGGLSMICHRYAKANNPYMRTYDPSLPCKYIIYLDSNNLYGHAMSDYLPNCNFEWMKREELNIDDIMKLPPDSHWGCFLEVDLDYPDVLHNDHADYPLAAEKMKVCYSNLSPFSQKICDQHNLKRSTNTEKLMTTLSGKRNYVLHYRLLQYYLQKGMKLLCIHSGVKFSQSPIMREYVDFNSTKRARASNDFESAIAKLLSNAVFGKTIERPDKRIKVRLFKDKKKFQKAAGLPTFKRSMRINDKLACANMKFPVIKMNKPFFLGVAILELSKLHMYRFHYDYIKKRYGLNAKLLFTDTDSLAYLVSTEDIYKDFNEHKVDYFDFSNYPKTHPNYCAVNKRVPGYFKDETASVPITCFVGLRSKMYSFLMESQKLKCVMGKEGGADVETKIAKGIKNTVIERDLSYDDYLNCLMDNVVMENAYNTIRSVAHQVCTNRQSKVSLSPFDDKRYLLDNINTLPHGHKDAVNLPEGDGSVSF